jgi:hypothetical protein
LNGYVELGRILANTLQLLLKVNRFANVRALGLRFIKVKYI